MAQTHPLPLPEAKGLTTACGEVLQLGEWRFEPELDRLSRDGEAAKLEPQLARLLLFLVRGSGRVLTKDEILDGVWGTRIVADSALTRSMAELRRALGDDAHHPRYIQTIPKRGYRMIAEPKTGAPGAGTGPAAVTPVVGDRHRRYAALVLLGLFALLVTSDSATSTRHDAPASATDSRMEHRLAVLPLDNLTRDPEQDFFASGMTEALITNLARLESLSVISRRSVEPFRGRRSLAEIAERLNVDLVVEGSVLRADGRIRVSVQLTDLDDEAHVWAESYEREARDVLAMQSEISQAIAGEIRATLATSSASGERPIDPEAYELYLKGRDYLKRCNREGPNAAADYFQAALEVDPSYAPAYAGLADYYTRLTMYGHSTPDSVLPLARAAARQALTLDADLTEAHAALAFVRFAFDLDWDGAERDYRHALTLSPGDAQIHLRYAFFLTCLARFEDALAEARRAVELDPLTARTRIELAWVYLNARQYERGLAELQRAAEIDSADGLHPYASWIYSLAGRHSEALVEIERHGQKKNGASPFLGVRGWILARAGRVEQAQQVRRQLERQAPDPDQDPYGLALVYAGLGEIDLAIGALERAYVHRSPNLIYLKTEPFFDNLQADPRYRRLLEKVGLG